MKIFSLLLLTCLPHIPLTGAAERHILLPETSSGFEEERRNLITRIAGSCGQFPCEGEDRTLRDNLFIPITSRDQLRNPIKACCVNYVRRAGSKSFTCIGLIPLVILLARCAPVTIRCLFPNLDGCCVDFDLVNCSECAHGHADCNNLNFEALCPVPFPWDEASARCQTENNILNVLCILSRGVAPLCGWGLDYCCLDYLSNLKNWRDGSSDAPTILHMEEARDDAE